MSDELSAEQAHTIVTDTFRWVLGREPDEVGLAHFTAALTTGGMSVVAVIQAICESEEGKACRRVVVADPSSESAEGSARDQAEQSVTSLYRLVLQRDPDEGGLEASVHMLLNGDATPMTILRSLLTSEEFGLSVARHPRVARHLARTVIATLMQRDPGEEAVSAYAQSLESGYPLDAFLAELIGSEEFAQLRGGAGRPSASSPNSLAGLAHLAEGLIIAQLISEGCNLAWPPQTDGAAHIAEKHVREALQTLAMLARTNSAQVATAQIQ